MTQTSSGQFSEFQSLRFWHHSRGVVDAYTTCRMKDVSGEAVSFEEVVSHVKNCDQCLKQFLGVQDLDAARRVGKFLPT